MPTRFATTLLRAASRSASAYLAIALELDEGGSALAELRAAAADVFRGGDADVGFLERGAAAARLRPSRARSRREQRAHGRDALAEERRQAQPRPAFQRRRRVGRAAGDASPPAPRRRDRRWRSAGACSAAGASRRTMTLGAYPLLYEGADLHACRRSHEASSHRCASTTTSTKPNSNARSGSSSKPDRTSKRRRLVSTCTGIPYSTACGRSARSARRSLESPHDQLTLRLAVAIDALHSS